MSGPFPGMDPYLENPVLWPGVHQGIISNLRALLNTLLPPGYVADMGERVSIAIPDRSIYPDVAVFQQNAPSSTPRNSSAATAVADPPLILWVEQVEIREVFIEIRPVGEEVRIVTVIELLSYINKSRGSDSRELYLTKQKQLLNSSVNLIEIDLLRRGDHTAAVPIELLTERGDHWNYLVCLHRCSQRDRFDTWPRTVRQRLPLISVPLEGDLPDVILDIQAVFDRNYDEGAYARRIDYRRDPATPLERGDAEWANMLIEEFHIGR